MLPHALVVATTVITVPPLGRPEPGLAPEDVAQAVSASTPADVAVTAPTTKRRRARRGPRAIKPLVIASPPGLSALQCAQPRGTGDDQRLDGAGTAARPAALRCRGGHLHVGGDAGTDRLRTSSGARLGSGRPSGGTVITVVATTNAWGSIAAQLGGTHVREASLITNPDTDPHDYEPTPAMVRASAGV